MDLILDSNGASAAAAGAAAPSAHIKDVTIETFGAEVIEASMSVPVVVDFWSEGCGPCKTLTPILEKITKQADGQVILAKVDVGDPMNRELAMQLRIQSVPTIYAFVQGRPVDGFNGAVPESDVRSFYERLVGGPIDDPVEQVLEAADAALADEALDAAFQLYKQVMGREPGHPGAVAGLMRCLVKLGEVEQARAFADSLDPQLLREAKVAAALSAVEMAEQAVNGADTAELDVKLAADADDHQARFDRAMARFAADERDGAVEDLVEIVRRDRVWNEEAARTQLLKFFEAWGPMDPASQAGRRRLSTVLFS